MAHSERVGHWQRGRVTDPSICRLTGLDRRSRELQHVVHELLWFSLYLTKRNVKWNFWLLSPARSDAKLVASMPAVAQIIRMGASVRRSLHKSGCVSLRKVAFPAKNSIAWRFGQALWPKNSVFHSLHREAQ